MKQMYMAEYKSVQNVTELKPQHAFDGLNVQKLNCSQHMNRL